MRERKREGEMYLCVSDREKKKDKEKRTELFHQHQFSMLAPSSGEMSAGRSVG